MSKAFINENSENIDGADSELDADDQEQRLPQGGKNYITPGGAERLKAELRTLLHVTRPEVVQTVSWAASNGDRSENGDYIYGKRRLREIDRRIRFLTRRLEIAEIVDPVQRGRELASRAELRILFGATVTIEDEDGQQKKIQIVGIDEAQPSSGKISWISPLAQALLNAREGDAITFRSPKGEEELVVLKVAYQAIE